MSNSNLHKAKAEKNDEFYTMLTDIEQEMKHYHDHFKGKHIFLNCDDDEHSKFWFFFQQNFEVLGLRKLTATHFERDNPTYRIDMEYNINGDGLDIVKTPFLHNGDFRSTECVEILKECDLVITNPPFSLFGEYVEQLMEYKKEFLIIGNGITVIRKDIFNYFQEGKLWLGINSVKEFTKPDGSTKKFGNILWYTNLTHHHLNEDIPLFREYNQTDYPQYDNCEAIHVDKVKYIPKDYYEPMGVPISYLPKHNPSQFKILGLSKRHSDSVVLKPGTTLRNAYLDGKKLFTRIFIQRIK